MSVVQQRVVLIEFGRDNFVLNRDSSQELQRLYSFKTIGVLRSYGRGTSGIHSVHIERDNRRRTFVMLFNEIRKFVALQIG